MGAEPPARRIALVYGRKSFVRNRAVSLSVEKQVEYCLADVERRGLTPEVYRDDKGHRSGRYEKTRPEWLRVKQRLKDPDVAALVVYEFDRASRSVRDSADLIEACQGFGVAIISIQDHIDTTNGIGSDEITYILMKAVWSQRESDKSSERQKDRVRYLKSKGVYWGDTPFGSIRVGLDAGAHMVRNAPHDETVRALMELYATGLSPQAVRDELNQRGYIHLDRKGNPVPFRLGGVQSIAWNVLFYAGYLVVNRRWKSKHSKIELSGEGTWLERYAQAMGAVRSPGIEPIIGDDLANRVIRRRFMARRIGKTTGRWVALLTPIVYYQNQQLRAQSRGYYYVYRTCERVSRQFEGQKLDADLVDHLSGIHVPEPLLRKIRVSLESRDVSGERARLRHRVDELENKKARIKKMHMNGFLDEEEFVSEFRATERELLEAQQAMNTPTDIDQLMQALTNVGATLKLISPERRKRAIQHLFQRVEINAQGEIVRLQPHEWAHQAFGHLVGALRNVYLRYPRQDLNPQHPP